MTLCDGTDDPATWDGVYETLTNIWVAHAHRRSGVATALLEFVQERSDVAIARLARPFSPAGTAWAQAELCTSGNRARSQRPVPVRLRQEVQALLRSLITAMLVA
jgi:hypothetical protein